MEFSASAKHHPVRTKSKKNVAPSRSRKEAPIRTSFGTDQTSILPCKKISDVSTPFVFGACSAKSGAASVVLNGGKESESGCEGEEVSAPLGSESFNVECGNENERSKQSEFSSDLKEGLLSEVMDEVRELRMDERSENGCDSSDLAMNNEGFICGKSVEKESNEILGRNVSPDFAFGSKSSGIGSETSQKEIKVGRNGDKRVQKKGEIRKNQRGMKLGASSNLLNEKTDFVNDYEPMDYSPYEEVSIPAEYSNNNDYTNHEAGNNSIDSKYRENLATNNFNTEKEVSSEIKDSDLNSENLRTKTTNLDSKFNTQINKSKTLFNSSVQTNVNNFSFSSSKNPNSDKITTKKHNRKKHYKSRVGPSIYAANNVYLNQVNNNSDLSSNPQISPNISFELNKSSITSNKETVGTDEDCEKWRARGNQAYEKGDMKAAEESYTIGINSLSPDSKSRALMLCYSNRAASRISLGKIKDALNDCLIASNIDSSFTKVKLRAANCFIALGDFEEAIKYYNKCLESNSDTKIFSEASNGLKNAKNVSELIIQAEEIIQKGKSDELSKALDIISEAFLISTHSDKLMKMKAEILLTLGRYEDAIKLCEKNLNENEKDFESEIWRFSIVSKSYFYLGKLDESLNALRKKEQATVNSSRRREIESTESDSAFLVTVQELIRLKAKGNESFQSSKFLSAIENYSSAINLSKESKNFTAICLCNRAACYQSLGQIADAISDCSLSFALYNSYAKAISRRATLYEMIRDYSQAAKDLQTLISLLEKNNQIQENQILKVNNNISDELNRARERLVSAEEESKKGIPLDLYLILGVEQLSSLNDVKKAYRKAALKHHPDKAGQFLLRNETRNEAFHKDADHLFKIIGEAYNVLSDSTKRTQYDNDEQKRASKIKGSTR